MNESEKGGFDGTCSPAPAPAAEDSLGPATSGSQQDTQIVVDKQAERSYVRKMDKYLLPFLSLMYFFNSIDRTNLANAQTDGLGTDLGFVGEQYSLLVLLFYVPNGLCDLPLNLLTKRLSGRVMLPGLMFCWGAMALLQNAARDFAGLLVLRLFLGAFEAGFFAGTVFYLTLFYTRGELGFRIALYFGSALLASAFSGLVSFGVFQIDDPLVKGWMWLFIIEGSLTIIVATAGFFWLPASPQTAWFLTPAEKAASLQRTLRDSSSSASSTSSQENHGFHLAECFATWRSWTFLPWCVISFTYPVAFATCANFLPLVLARLGRSAVATNLLTVPPNCAGFAVLLAVCRSSDARRERTWHIVFALVLSLVGLVILAVADIDNASLAYFATFLLAAGAYVPSCLVHAWHNNNNVSEHGRAATTGLLVGLGNLAGILSAATFRAAYAPRYAPCLVATAACTGVCIVATLGLGLWMKAQNRRRDAEQGGVRLRAGDVDTGALRDGERDPRWRYFT